MQEFPKPLQVYIVEDSTIIRRLLASTIERAPLLIDLALLVEDAIHQRGLATQLCLCLFGKVVLIAVLDAIGFEIK